MSHVKTLLAKQADATAASASAACAASNPSDDSTVTGSNPGDLNAGSNADEDSSTTDSSGSLPHLRIQEDKGFGPAEPHKILVDDLPLAGDAGQLHLVKYSTKTLYVQVCASACARVARASGSCGVSCGVSSFKMRMWCCPGAVAGAAAAANVGCALRDCLVEEKDVWI